VYSNNKVCGVVCLMRLTNRAVAVATLLRIRRPRRCSNTTRKRCEKPLPHNIDTVTHEIDIERKQKIYVVIAAMTLEGRELFNGFEDLP